MQTKRIVKTVKMIIIILQAVESQYLLIFKNVLNHHLEFSHQLTDNLRLLRILLLGQDDPCRT